MNFKTVLCLAVVLSGHCHAAIIFPKQAEEYRDIARRETIAFFRGSPPSLPKCLQMDNLNVTMGHKYYWPDYRLGSPDKLLSITVTSPSWEYMLMCGTNMVGTVGLGPDSSNHWSCGGATFRGQPDPIWVGLERAEGLPQVKSKDYEFRFLSLIGADYPTIWLHGDRDDILIPLSDGYGKLEAYKPYTESEMIKLLRPMFENMMGAGGSLENTNAIPGNK